MMHRMLSLVTAVAMLMSAGCHAQSTDNTKSAVPQDWKTECVGRYQVSVPEEVEMALSSYKHFFDENNPNPYRFSDDTIAPYSRIGGLEITSLVSKTEFEELEKHVEKNSKAIISRLRDSNRDDLADSIKPFPTHYKQSFAWQNKNGIRAYLYFNQRVLTFTGTTAEDIQDILKTFRPRALYDLVECLDPLRCFARVEIDRAFGELLVHG